MTAPPVSYLQTPATICNQALDLIGAPEEAIIGDIADGTRVAEAARRAYGQALRQLLRTAWWDFARKRAKLTLLGDATGQSAPPVSEFVECPWLYAYESPVDCVQGRWLPWNPTNAQPETQQGIPLTTGVSTLTPYPMQPGRFLVSSSDQYPIEVGSVPWDQLPDLQRTFGVGPTNRRIILTDCCEAWYVYTRFVPVIEEWDGLFRQAMVIMMALALVNVALEDVKLRVGERDRLVPQLKNAIADARLASANEAGFPQSTDHLPIWITARSGGWGGRGGDAYGGLSGYTYFPWDGSMSWCGSVF